MQDISKVVNCAFCGRRKIPETTKSGMLTPLTTKIPIDSDVFGRGGCD